MSQEANTLITRRIAALTLAATVSLALIACGAGEPNPDNDQGQSSGQDEIDRAIAESDEAKAEAERDKAEADAERAKADAAKAREDAARAQAEAERAGAATAPKRGDYNADLSPTAELQGGQWDWWSLDISGDGVTDTVRVRWEGRSGYQVAGYDVDQDGDLDEFLDQSGANTRHYGYDVNGDELPDEWIVVSGTGNGIPDELEG
jgi:hypothetical protein